ncbi:MAG TPA: hypothetical protein VN726_14910 [Hanamia sp.]|nr:hypothetical protein [Hanamia sp.]
MKKIWLIVLLICLISFSCGKTPIVVNTILTRQWTLIETLVDPGGQWRIIT